MNKKNVNTTLLITILLLISTVACVGLKYSSTSIPLKNNPEEKQKTDGNILPYKETIQATPEIISYDNLIKLAWFYNPPIDNDLQTIASNFDVFILTKNYNGERETLRRLGIKTPIIKYLAFFEIQDMPCDEQPWQNNVAYKIGDFCSIKDGHKDWFLKDSNEDPLCIDGFCMMDPGNQEWLNFWLQRAIETQEQNGWDGIFMDNVEASLGKRDEEDLIPAAYPENQKYQNVIVNALQFFYKAYFQPQKKPLYANIIAVDEWEVWLRYLNYLDGAMIEDFAVDWDSDFKTTEEWEEQMAAIEQAQTMGKNIILVSQGVRDDYDRQQFSFASYLLVNNGNVSFRYTEDRVYDEIWLYDNYKIDLGIPKGPRFKEGDTWKRNFSKGEVMLNPVDNNSDIIIY